MALKMHEVNKAHMPKMENGDPLGDQMINQLKTERATRREQETTPTKKQKLERLVVNEVVELIFEGRIPIFIHDASVWVITDYENKCNVYECDNLTKYKIAIDKTDNFPYTLSAQYAWQICDQNVQRQFPPIKVRLARANPGKEIVLHSAGNRDSVIMMFLI